MEPEEVLELICSAPDRYDTVRAALHYRGDGPTIKAVRERFWSSEASLRRVVEDGRTVAWDAFFRVDRPDVPYYLSTFGLWKDADGSGYQDASWTFRVQTRSSST